MTHRWARMFVSVAAAAVLSATMLGAVGGQAVAKEPKLSADVYKVDLEVLDTASILLNPVARTASVAFGKAYRNRVVSLQSRLASNDLLPWRKAGRATRLSSSGNAIFTLTAIDPLVTYRAAVDKASSTKPAKASKPTTLATQWVSVLDLGFTPAALGAGATWDDREPGFQVPSRLCSVPSTSPSVRSMTKGRFVAGVVKYTSGDFHSAIVKAANEKATAAYNKAMAAAAKLSKSKRKTAEKVAKAVKKTVWNCPSGVFENTAISTDADLDSQGFTINTATPGILSARITFPKAQGMHGSVWLQHSLADTKGGEIDFIESFGFGSGITSVVHDPTNRDKNKRKVGGYVLTSKKNNKAWWGKPHDYSLEWTSSTFTFRVDGSVTRKIKRTLPNSRYYLVASLLTSDWELGRLRKPIGKGVKTTDVSKQKMVVDSIQVWTKA